jgi:hypothetical protein
MGFSPNVMPLAPVVLNPFARRLAYPGESALRPLEGSVSPQAIRSRLRTPTPIPSTPSRRSAGRTGQHPAVRRDALPLEP